MKRIGALTIIALVIFSMVGFLAEVLSVSAYYVDAVNGSDGRTCAQAQSSSTPKKTINGGIACLSGGDTLNVRAGTYNEGINYNIPSGGGPLSNTVIQGFGGDATPTMHGALTLALNNYITWNGINIDDAGDNDTTDCVLINSGTGITITHAELKNCQRHGVLTGDGNSQPIGSLTFSYLNVHNTGQGYLTSPDPRHHNFYISAHNFPTTGTILLDHIESHNEGNPANQGTGGPSGSAENSWGIQIYNSGSPGYIQNVTVSNSYIHDNNQGIVVGSGPNHKIFNNVIANNNNHAGAGCEAAITVGYNTVNVNNIQVYNNAIYGNRGQNQASLGFDCTGAVYAISVGTFGNPTNTIIRNNIMWQNDHDSVNLAGGSGTIVSNSFASDPLFVNAGAGDFHLQSGSGARNFGMNLSSIIPGVDADGNARPVSGNWDDGPYQFSGAITPGGPATTGTLALPVSLVWAPSSGPSLAGYNIYRSTTSGVFTGSPLNGSLVTSTFYQDNTVQSGNTYYYIVRSVNTSAVESTNSNQTQVVR